MPDTMLKKVLVKSLLVLGRGVGYLCFGCIWVCCCGRVHQPGFRCGNGVMQERKRKQREENIKAWRKLRKKSEPKVLPRRRRALSVPPARRKSPAQPSTSPFLCLPTEIRQKILVEVLGNNVLHLIQLPKRLGHLLCDEHLWTYKHLTAPFYDIRRDCFRLNFVPKYHHDEKPAVPPRSTGGCLALLQTCRQLYLEAGCVLYETNTFDINHPQTLIFLARTLRPQILERIRYLQISWTAATTTGFSRRSTRQDFVPYEYTNPKQDAARAPDDTHTWEQMWDIVGSQMKGLQHLKLRLDISLVSCFEPPNMLEDRCRSRMQMMLNAPQAKVRGLKSFWLELPENFHTYFDQNRQSYHLPPVEYLRNVQEELEKETRALCVA